MEIQVIGTGDIWSNNNSPAYLINNKILIDIPNGTIKNMKRMNIDLKKIKYVLLTHLHGDHYFDMPFYLLSKTKLVKKDDIYITLSKHEKSKIKKLTKLAFPNSIRKIKKKAKIHYNTKKSFYIYDYYFRKIKMKHSNLDCYGYIIETDDHIIGFTGDASYSKNVELMAKVCDYLFIDTTYIYGNKKHMGIDDLKFLALKYQNCIFIPTHMSNKSRETINDKMKNILILNDGDILKI